MIYFVDLKIGMLGYFKKGNSMTYNKESFLQGMFKTIILKHIIKFTFFSCIKSIIP
jgi:hypothetical protein